MIESFVFAQYIGVTNRPGYVCRAGCILCTSCTRCGLIIRMIMFTVLSSWHSSCKSLSTQFAHSAPGCCQPSEQANKLGL